MKGMGERDSRISILAQAFVVKKGRLGRRIKAFTVFLKGPLNRSSSYRFCLGGFSGILLLMA